MNTTKYKKINMMEHKTEITLLKLANTKKTEQQFYDRAPNTWTLLNTKN